MREDNDTMYLEYPADPVEDLDQDDELEAPEQAFDEGEITRLAREVLEGKHGRGADREESLGDMYQSVQEEVRRLRLQGA